MKGKKGGERPKDGVSFADAAIPVTSKGNVLAAAKKRRRGGAVAPLKVNGDMPKARLDKPKRAIGGSVDDKADKGLVDTAKKAASQAMKPSTPKTGDIMQSKVHANEAKRASFAPERKRGGRIGADTSPMTHAATEKPTRGHSTGGNI